MNGDTAGSCARILLSCLGEASRFRLVQALAAREMCVGELALAVGLSQSCTTRHLQALQRAGLVKGQREGRKVRFRLSAGDPGLEALLAWVLSGPEQTLSQPPGMPVPAAAPPSRARTTGRRTRTGSGLAPASPPAPAASETQAPTSPPSVRPGDLEDFLL